MDNEVIIEAPAKINLTLDVINKRQDGYHNIATVMQQISLADRVFIKRADNGITLSTDSHSLAVNEENLAYQAARMMLNHYGLNEGIQIFIEKNIPIAAGLAGGSSDAAAVIKGVKQLFALDISASEMFALGACLGSDVPFCLMGGTALATGRGEILKPLPQGPELNIVLVKPIFSLSTAEVYKHFDRNQVSRFPDNEKFLSAWEHGNLIEATKYMENTLESVSLANNKSINTIKEKLLQMGALKAMMSGSGPTVFGIFTNQGEAWKAFKFLQKEYEQCYIAISYKRGGLNGKTSNAR